MKVWYIVSYIYSFFWIDHFRLNPKMKCVLTELKILKFIYEYRMKFMYFSKPKSILTIYKSKHKIFNSDFSKIPESWVVFKHRHNNLVVPEEFWLKKCHGYIVLNLRKWLFIFSGHFLIILTALILHDLMLLLYQQLNILHWHVISKSLIHENPQ